MLDLKKIISKILQNLIVKSFDYSNFTYSSGFTYYSTSGEHTPKAEKIGRTVSLNGVFKATAAKSGTGSYQIGTVPLGCEPLTTQYFLCQCYQGGRGFYRLAIYTNGDMYIDLYGIYNASATAIANNHWFNISSTYISKS